LSLRLPPIQNVEGRPDLYGLIPGKIHLWYACVDRSPKEIGVFASVLSAEETTRSQRFRLNQDRDRYIVRHGVLHSLLSGYLGCEPRQVNIYTSDHGKPCLSNKGAEISLQFSLSHSGAYAAFAFGRCNSIGVDIEAVREIPEMEGIVDQHFTPREKDEMVSCPAGIRLETFYRIWTRKEAVLKAQGEGLFRPLDSVDVAICGGTNPCRVEVTGEGSIEEYRLFDVDTYPGFCAAVAVNSSLEKFLLSVNYL
jgi:4'-phosphopantetheinyl transferase